MDELNTIVCDLLPIFWGIKQTIAFGLTLIISSDIGNFLLFLCLCFDKGNTSKVAFFNTSRDELR